MRVSRRMSSAGERDAVLAHDGAGHNAAAAYFGAVRGSLGGLCVGAMLSSIHLKR